MREIKFKAYHKAENVMSEVEIINFDKGAFLTGVMSGEDVIGEKYFIPAPTRGRFCYFDEFELLQFTGLLDKNGKEIYEGDVVVGDKGFMSPVKGIIEYHGMGFVCVGKSEEGKTWWLPSTSDLDTFYEIEVIGNIHSNPELL